MLAVFLANGFEEIEALATVDILRRAGLSVKTVGIGGATIVGAHDIPVTADLVQDALDFTRLDGVILPGGMPGTTNLDASSVVDSALRYAVDNSLPVAAICAAPLVLGRRGYLTGRRATCYPGFEDELKGATVVKNAVVTDGLFTTASGAGVAVDFALELVARLVSTEKAEEIRGAIQCR